MPATKRVGCHRTPSRPSHGLAIVAVLVSIAGCKERQPTEPPAACDSSGVDTCETQRGCALIRARRHIADEPCAELPEAVGCKRPGPSCDDAITFARDLEGAGWWFADACIPAGWTVEPYPQDLSDVPPTCP